MAEFERDLIHERTNAGLAAARARGRLGGRKQRSIPEVCRTHRISRSTFYRYMTGPGAPSDDGKAGT